jgi:hypothetical protein
MESPSSLVAFIKKMERISDGKQILSEWLIQAFEVMQGHDYLEDRKAAVSLGRFIMELCEGTPSDETVDVGLWKSC